MFKSIVVCAATLTLFAVGCAKDPDHQASSPKNDDSMATRTTAATSPNLINNSTAVNKITGARCTREEKCNNVGAGKKYVDRDACEREVMQNTQSDLRASECAGVVPKELDECLDEVQNQACNNPIDAVSRVAACTRSQLCQ